MNNTETKFDYSVWETKENYTPKSFTSEGMESNHITRHLTQSLKHRVYHNVEVSISGMDNNPNSFSVWVKGFNEHSQIADDLNISQAVEIANKNIEA